MWPSLFHLAEPVSHTFFEQFKNKRCFVTGDYRGEKTLWHYKPLFSSASDKPTGQSAASCLSMKPPPPSSRRMTGAGEVLGFGIRLRFLPSPCCARRSSSPCLYLRFGMGVEVADDVVPFRFYLLVLHAVQQFLVRVRSDRISLSFPGFPGRRRSRGERPFHPGRIFLVTLRAFEGRAFVEPVRLGRFFSTTPRDGARYLRSSLRIRLKAGLAAPLSKSATGVLRNRRGVVPEIRRQAAGFFSGRVNGNDESLATFCVTITRREVLESGETEG